MRNSKEELKAKIRVAVVKSDYEFRLNPFKPYVPMKMEHIERITDNVLKELEESSEAHAETPLTGSFATDFPNITRYSITVDNNHPDPIFRRTRCLNVIQDCSIDTIADKVFAPYKEQSFQKMSEMAQFHRDKDRNSVSNLLVSLSKIGEYKDGDEIAKELRIEIADRIAEILIK